MDEMRFQTRFEELSVTLRDLNGQLELNVTNFNEQLKRLAQERYSESPHQKVKGPLKDLCTLYLGANSEQRDQIRRTLNDMHLILSHLLGYPSYVSGFINSPDDAQWLRIGLAAASIENARNDWRDLLVSLGPLYLAAEDAGIDPRPHFQELGELSIEPVRRILKGFHESAYLASLGRKEKTCDNPNRG